MDWKTMAIDDLREYNARRQSLEILPMQIAEIDAEMTGIRSSGNMASVSVSGGSGSREDVLISRMVKKEKLQRNLDRAKLWVGFMDKGLAALTEDERHILDRFYINPAKGNVDRLCEELFVEKTALYKRKDAALRRFTVVLYGCAES